MKWSKWFLAAVCVCLLLAALPAMADTVPHPAASARGVYLNGLVYRVFRTGGSITSSSPGVPLTMQIGVPASQTAPYTGTNRVLVAPPSPVPSQVHSTFLVCEYSDRLYGGSMAVFNGKIYYGYTAVDCSTGGGGTYMASFDPQSNTWVGNTSMGNFPAGSGAALAVFKGKLWLFAQGGIWSSANPDLGWAWDQPLTNVIVAQPLDAIAISPQNSPQKLLIVYGVNTGGGYDTELDYLVWDGSRSAMNYFLTPTRFSQRGYWSGEVSLQTGTAANSPNSVRDKSGAFASFKTDLTNSSPVAVQVFALQLPSSTVVDRGTVVHFEYNIAAGTWTTDSSSFPYGSTPAADLWTYPWFALRCIDDPIHAPMQGLHQLIVVNYLLASGTSTTGISDGFAYDSDYLVPQNKNTANSDLAINTCADTGGHNNITSGMGNKDTASHYWSLLGVVLGSPPFAVNGVTNPSTIEKMSNVDFGTTTGHALEYTQEWGKTSMLSSGVEVSAGFAGVGVSNNFDVSYKQGEDHAHQSETATAVGLKTQLGTNTGFGTATPGAYGWAIFSKPNIRVQDYAIYGHNYDPASGGGKYLSQDLTTMSKVNNSTTVEPFAFDLRDPSKGEDGYTFMKGMPGIIETDPVNHVHGFPYSTDLNGWKNANWEVATGQWKVLLGTGQFNEPAWNTIKFGPGQNGGVSWTSTVSETAIDGETSSLGLSNTTTLDVQTLFVGFKANLTVGTESSFSTTTADTSSMTTDLAATVNMNLCGPDVPAGTVCACSITTRPYYLRATSATAPWIPSAFQRQRPWAITWKVDDACTTTAPAPCPTDPKSCQPPPIAGGPPGSRPPQYSRYGQSLPPRQASGRIVGGYGGGEGGDPLSHYSLEGGRLWWVDENGVETTRIPLTADAFDPSRGASFDLLGQSWSTVGAAGSWTRSGDVWTFTSGGQVRENRVLLNLDFGQGMFNLHLDKVDFEERLQAAVDDLPMNFTVNTVNGQYTFHTVLDHDYDITWQLSQPPANNTTMQVTSFNGRYNNATGAGNMNLAGTLPAVSQGFGDMALTMNGRTLLIPVLSMDGFAQAIESSGVFRHVKDGLNLKIDFGNKTWSATINNQAFQQLLALSGGGSDITFDVGGEPWFNQDEAVVNFTAKLTLHNN